ncbi:MAG: hypothetical protein CL763_08970 [Chloroflexi bacterium]|nr:hypothetical protein [Chloroflexota bacterium]|tara:strand:- start:55 stop:1185 length:1131 start_codon:yes stop_codon:yes gene_type:complete
MKILQILFLISIVLISLYIFDKFTSENPNDSANIVIGISNIGSESCLQCKMNGESYERGCKACPQDNINFRIKSIENKPFISSWSKDNAMFYGDKQCDGEIELPLIKAETNIEYWTEIKLKNSESIITIYKDSDFEEKISMTTNKICTLPSDLKFLRFSMNDGKPIAEGGRLIGNIDNIEIFNYESSKNNSFESVNKLSKIYEENFSNCTTKNCDKWVLQNPDVFFINTEKEYFHFDSYVSGNNDYAHYELPNSLSEKEWMLRLLLSFDQIDEFPHGKGVLGIEPDLRNFIFIFTSVLIALPTAFFSIKEKSWNSNILMIIFSSILLYVSIIPFIPNYILNQNVAFEKILTVFGLIVVSLILISFGTHRIYSITKK